nr:response regulator [Vibrio sp. N418]
MLQEKIFNLIETVDVTNIATEVKGASPSISSAVHHPAPDEVQSANVEGNHSDTPKTVGRHERILLVEDNRVNQKVASLMLDKAGFHYAIAENGQIAIDMYSEDSSFDVILMDCMMPVKDGFEATREIRQHEVDFGLVKTPIIALTASVIDDDIQRCFDSGMDAYVAKPVRKDNLIEKIESII